MRRSDWQSFGCEWPPAIIQAKSGGNPDGDWRIVSPRREPAGEVFAARGQLWRANGGGSELDGLGNWHAVLEQQGEQLGQRRITAGALHAGERADGTERKERMQFDSCSNAAGAIPDESQPSPGEERNQWPPPRCRADDFGQRGIERGAA